MTSPRARLLAILKEPDRYFVRYATWSFAARVMDAITGDRASGMLFRIQAETLAADLNARHRLKRLCEEIAKGDPDLIEKMCIAADPDLFGDKIAKWESDREIVRRDIRNALAAILALGEPNEHS